jgi:phenylpyruvate tautomerase PptA (4-oxalocrotonate tautomerase family)
MPLVEIEHIGAFPRSAHALSQELADALATVFSSARAETWVRLRSLSSENYAENGEDDPLGAEAIFVSITKKDLPSSSLLANQATAVASVVATVFQRSIDRVHIIYEPPARNRIAFGGRLIS